MSLRTDLYIAGEWRSSPRTVAVHDPSEGSVIAHVAVAEPADLDDAVDAAADSFPSFAATPPRERAEMLRRAFEIMTSERVQIAEIVSRSGELIIADQLGRESVTGPVVVPASLAVRRSTAPVAT